MRRPVSPRESRGADGEEVTPKELWLGRGTATVMGVAILLAVVLGVATTALAAVPEDPFRLGETNIIDALTRLKGTVSNTILRIDNDSTDA